MTTKKSFKEQLHTFRTSEETKIVYVREISYVLGTVGLIVAILYLICGTWPAIVTIESGSMEPNMNIGDLVLVVAHNRFGTLQSYAEGEQTGHEKFGLPGDVIIFRANGNRELHPIIHRALYWSEEGEEHIFYDDARAIEYTAPNAGYITKGDNNSIEDQVGWENYRGLGSPILPVEEQWIVGKAYAKIPYVGYLPLNIGKVIVVLILLIVIHELYLRSKEENEEKTENAKKQKKNSKK
jgi:signal peptidase